MRRICRIALGLAVLALLTGAPAQADEGFRQQPTDTPVGETISPAVSVRIDSSPTGNIAGISVSVSLCGGPAGASLQGQTQGTTDASGFARFPDLSISQTGEGFLLCARGGETWTSPDGNENAWAFLTYSNPFRVFLTGASTKRKGPEALHLYTLGLAPGVCHPAQPVSGCETDPDGDWLPAGAGFTFIFGSVFDTGSTVVMVNNVSGGYPSDANTLNLCNLSGDCPQLPPTVTLDPAYPNDGDRDGVVDTVDNCPLTVNASQSDTDQDGHGNACDNPYLPNELDVPLWGLGAYVEGPQGGVPWQEATVVSGIHVRPGSQALLPTLIGAPVAARVIASIDYANTVTKQFPFGARSAPDIHFYPRGNTQIPVPPYRVLLERRGDYGEAQTDQASVGPRFMVKYVTLTEGVYSIDDQDFQVLYDTGSTTTVVTEEVAAALGIDVATETPVDYYRLNTVRGEALVLGYVIDRFGITTIDGFHEYRIDHPMIYVQRNLPDGRAPFPEGIDIVLGSNYFAGKQVLFDGPGDNLGLWEAVSIDPDGDRQVDARDNCPTVYNPDQMDRDHDGAGDACDPDDDNDGIPDGADNCQFVPNAGQQNTDQDNLGDACDLDDDNDGVLDEADNCSVTYNPDQTNHDADAAGDACDWDDDNDNWLDGRDNCQFVWNSDQLNSDDDNLGDACDPDDDNDGVLDAADNCSLLLNPDQVDSDLDRLGDPCDPVPMNGSGGPEEQAATVVPTAGATSLSTPNDALTVEIPSGAVSTPRTLTLLPGEDGFQVVGSIGSGSEATMEVLLAYDVRIGGQTSYPLPTGKFATLTFEIPESDSANQAFATRTLAIASKEDTDGDGTEDTFVLIPDCASGEKTADGRCTTVTALDGNGDGVTDGYQLSALVPHFSTYAVVAIETCVATANFDPRTLYRKSTDNWVTVYLEFPGCRFGPGQVAVPTVRLQAWTPVKSARIPVAAGAPATVGDKDLDSLPDLMVKFDRKTVSSWFKSRCQATFAVIGNFADDSTLFKATTGPVRIE